MSAGEGKGLARELLSLDFSLPGLVLAPLMDIRAAIQDCQVGVCLLLIPLWSHSSISLPCHCLS